MRLIALASQYSVFPEEVIIWAIDADTKIIIKAHISKDELPPICVGQIIEVVSISKCKRQEVEISSVKIIDDAKGVLCQYLDSMASRPYSIISPGYEGNIAKIEEVIEIAEDKMIVKLYGFPNELKYIQVHDEKWCKYMSECAASAIIKNDIVSALNKNRDKYVIIDFPRGSEKGHIQVAALVVI